MALNQKLTPLIAGRTIETVDQDGNLLQLHFHDGSILRIKQAAPGPIEGLAQRTIKSIRQKGNVFNLDFSDRSTASIQLAEPTSSVMLRDARGVLEYAD
jgi:hypothetical protein